MFRSACLFSKVFVVGVGVGGDDNDGGGVVLILFLISFPLPKKSFPPSPKR